MSPVDRGRGVPVPSLAIHARVIADVAPCRRDRQKQAAAGSSPRSLAETASALGGSRPALAAQALGAMAADSHRAVAGVVRTFRLPAGVGFLDADSRLVAAVAGPSLPATADARHDRSNASWISPPAPAVPGSRQLKLEPFCCSAA